MIREIDGHLTWLFRTEEQAVRCVGYKFTGQPDTPPLPATGLLWWPLPILIAGGVAFLLVGFFLIRKGNKSER